MSLAQDPTNYGLTIQTSTFVLIRHGVLLLVELPTDFWGNLTL